MRILFLCTSNINRSKTAERIFKDLYPEHSFMSAGLSRKYCEQYGSTLCTEEMLESADLVFVMEDIHVSRVRQSAGDRLADICINLNIKDEFSEGDPDLVDKLYDKVPHHIRKLESGE